MKALHQAPGAVVMVRPGHFNINAETASDNAFQQQQLDIPQAELARLVFDEVTTAVRLLRAQGVDVLLFDDAVGQSPDSVFPNNWFSTHADGTVVLYPMFSRARRHERRTDLIAALGERFNVKRVLDYSPYEEEGRFLEGTGSMVIDHQNGLIYAARSLRTDEHLVQQLGRDLGFEVVIFDAVDSGGLSVYHTNVMMSVGTEFAILCTDMIPDSGDQQGVRERLQACNKAVIEITEPQVRRFLGNVLELQSPNGKCLAMSRTAFNALTEQQRTTLQAFADFVVLDVPNIERSGGSVRCMLAGLHLPEPG